VGVGCSFKRWPAIWQRWSLHYQQLICHLTREGLEYTPLPTVPPPLAGLVVHEMANEKFSQVLAQFISRSGNRCRRIAELFQLVAVHAVIARVNQVYQIRTTLGCQ
jgi:hypothetical protein